MNHLFKQLRDVCPKANQWAAALHIHPESYHGGQFFRNSCHKLIKNVDLLQQMAESGAVFRIFGIIGPFREFEAVVAPLFENHHTNDFGEKIDQFENSFMALEIGTITPKLHFSPI